MKYSKVTWASCSNHPKINSLFSRFLRQRRRKQKSSTPLAFYGGIQHSQVDSLHEGPVTFLIIFLVCITGVIYWPFKLGIGICIIFISKSLKLYLKSIYRCIHHILPNYEKYKRFCCQIQNSSGVETRFVITSFGVVIKIYHLIFPDPCKTSLSF